MNKNKIMELVNSACAYSEEFSESGKEDSFSKRELVVECIEDELDSKPVMPKVFDDWYKSKQDETTKRELIHFYMDVSFNASDEMKSLAIWLKGNEKNYDR